MSTLFNFHYFLTVVLLGICACTYVKMQFPALLEQKTGFRGFFWKAARIGERQSHWMAVGCFTMGVSIIFFKYIVLLVSSNDHVKFVASMNSIKAVLV